MTQLLQNSNKIKIDPSICLILIDHVLITKFFPQKIINFETFQIFIIKKSHSYLIILIF